MDPDEILICRLCFEICKTNFKIMNDTDKEMLNLLQMKLNLDISNEPVMCNSCVDNLRECFTFKINRLYKNSDASIKHENIELDVANECPKRNVAFAFESLYSSDKCCSCMELVNQDTSVLLMNEEQTVTTLLEKYFPELVANSTTDAMCITCYKSLRRWLAFINKCLTIEEKTHEYCETEGTNSKGQVQLSSVLHFIPKNQLLNNIHTSLDNVKIEQSLEGAENETKAEIKKEDLIDVEEPGIYNIKKEDSDIGMERDDDDRSDTGRATTSKCIYRSKQKDGFLNRNQLSEIRVSKCKLCTFQTKHKSSLKRHMVTHKQTSNSASDVSLLKCEICPYRSRVKSNLSHHMLIHKDPSELEMYKCQLCTYQSKRKGNLTKHMLTHKHQSEITVYKCDMCPYQTRHKYILPQHMLTHEVPSEATTYKCQMCTFRTKHKRYLPEHMLSHKDPSERRIYKCKLCAFQTKYKCNFSVHMLYHKDPSDIAIYKCEICNHQSRRKADISRHMLTHKDPSEVVMYKCEKCSYRTKYKHNVSEHMMTHKDPSELIMYKCELCKYQTKRKRQFSVHMLSHKSPSEVNAYKCEICTYQGKRKSYLSKHMLTHKNPSDIKMFKCEVCMHQSKRKNDLLKHMQIHISTSDVTM